jgi:hypothetical protein
MEITLAQPWYTRLGAVLASSLLIASFAGAIAAFKPNAVSAPSLAAMSYTSFTNTDDEGAPILCPYQLPVTGWTWYPVTHYVPRFGQPSSLGVPFTPGHLEYTSQIQPVLMGQGWYVPSPDETEHEGLTWRWEAYGSPPGVLYKCRQYTFYPLFILQIISPMGPVWGHAIPTTFPPPPPPGTPTSGSGTRRDNEELIQVCWEAYNWWIDSSGNYHEHVYAEWCW